MKTTERHVRLYVLLVSVLALAATVVAASVLSPGDRRDWEAAAFFCAFGLLAHSLSYQTSRGRSGTIAFLPFLSIAALSPSIAALASVFLAVAIGELVVVRRAPLKASFNIAQHLLALSLSMLAFRASHGTSFYEGTPSVGSFILLCAVFFTTNRAVVSVVLALANNTSIRLELLRAARSSAINDVLALPLVMVFAFAYTRLGPVWSAILALPLLGVRQLYKSVFDLERINEELLQLMVAAIEARDPYTSGHSQRVARYSRVIARAVGLGSRQVDEVGTAALLHDVGKIHEEFAPILRLPRKLSDQEYEVMKTHSAKGATLVAKVSHFKAIVPAIRGHHEAWSGRGYPDGLAGDEIPLGARIITIADTIDAMTTVRPYRPPRSMDEVRAELERVSGTQFDPRICNTIFADAHWKDLRLEVEIAAREFPADAGEPEAEFPAVPRHSVQIPPVIQ